MLVRYQTLARRTTTLAKVGVVSSNLIARSKFFKDFTLGFSGSRQIASFAKPLGSQPCRRYETWERVKKRAAVFRWTTTSLAAARPGAPVTKRAIDRSRFRLLSLRRLLWTPFS